MGDLLEAVFDPDLLKSKFDEIDPPKKRAAEAPETPAGASMGATVQN